MRVDPQLVALRSDPASQRRSQEAVRRVHQAWNGSPEVLPFLQQCARFAAGDTLGSLRDLDTLMHDRNLAARFIDDWCDCHLKALSEHPLAQMPFRHSHSPGFSTVPLWAERGASLSLAVYEPVTNPVTSQSVLFSDREQHEMVIAGSAQALVCREEPETRRIETRSLLLCPGDTLSFDCNREMRQIQAVQGRLVLSQLTSTPNAPRPTREVRISDAALLLQSDGDKRVSQSAMALAVLGALGRTDAIPAMECISRSGPDHLRWEALRQMLTLDPFAGIAALDRLNQQPNESLAEPARNLAEQLREQHHELRQERAA